MEGFNLPTYDPGVFGHVAGGTMFGGMIGVKGSTSVGSTGGWDIVLGINAFGTFGGNSSSWANSVTSQTIVTGLDTPNYSPTPGLAVDNAGNASAIFGGAGGAAIGKSITSGGASINQGTVQPDTVGSGFAVSSLAVTPNSGAGFAAYGSATGGGFYINSTDGSAKIDTTVTRSIMYAGADLTLGLAGKFDGGSDVQVYAGPSFRSLSQGIKTALTADIDEAQPSLGNVLPTFTVALNDQLLATYFGGVVGSSVTFDAASDVKITLGMEAGAYSVSSSWNEHDTYSTCCGLDTSTGASPTLSVDGPNHTASLGTQVALAAKASAAASWSVDANKTVSLGGNIGYLSAVPTVSHSGLIGGSPTTTFGWGSMVTYGASASLQAHF